MRPDILPPTGSKVSIGYPRTSASEKRPESNRIVICFGRSPSVPGFETHLMIDATEVLTMFAEAADSSGQADLVGRDVSRLLVSVVAQLAEVSDQRL